MITEHERDEHELAEGAPARARWPLLLSVAAAALALDQLTKAWAVERLGDGEIIDLVGSLRLRLTMNYGSAFSLADGRGPLISLLALVVVALLLRTGRHATRPAMAVAIGLVLGGAIGNLIDRAFREGDGVLGGGVVDFVDLQWWPVFNVADSAIVVGAILLFAADTRIGAEGSFKIGLNEVGIGMPLPEFAVELARDRLAPHHLVKATAQGEIYDPVGAVEAGYLDRHLPAEQVLDAAMDEARRLSTLRRGAVAATKSNLRSATLRRMRGGLTDDIATLTMG